MTNPFTRFRQWLLNRAKNRYYQHMYRIAEYCMWTEERMYGIQHSEEEYALHMTRLHFDDPTFQPRGKQ